MCEMFRLGRQINHELMMRKKPGFFLIIKIIFGLGMARSHSLAVSTIL